MSLYEVDNAEEYSNFLEKEGYLTHYICVKDRTFKETTWGILVAVKAKEFKVLEYDQHLYSGSTAQQYWLLKLEDQKSKQRVNLVSTHLISKVYNEEARRLQAKELSQYISQLNNQEPETPILLVGDLNTEPTYESFKIIKETSLKKQSLESAYPLDKWTTCKQR